MQQTHDVLAQNPAPVVSLKTGVRVANFNNYDLIRFDDGTILLPCTWARVECLQAPRTFTDRPGIAGTLDSFVEYAMTNHIESEIRALQSRADVDIILVSPSVMGAVLDSYDVDMDKLRFPLVVDVLRDLVSATRFRQ